MKSKIQQNTIDARNPFTMHVMQTQKVPNANQPYSNYQDQSKTSP